jgi:hypothetical protein
MAINAGPLFKFNPSISARLSMDRNSQKTDASALNRGGSHFG